MMNSSPQSRADLSSLQRWMLAVITHPGGVEAGVHSPVAPGELPVASDSLEQVINQSPEWSSAERLAVYGNAYFARLIECLEDEFPATLMVAGKEAFAGLVVGFLQAHPPVSPTLGDLGTSFASYLAETRPPREGDSPDWADLLIDVAGLERLYSEVFDGPGEEDLPPFDVARLQTVPAEEWLRLRIVTAPSLRLTECRFPVQDLITAVRQQQPIPAITPEPTWLAVNRRDYVVRRSPLNAIQYHLLCNLQQGVPLGEALEQSLLHSPQSAESLVDDLRHWFQQFAADGYFVDFCVESSCQSASPRAFNSGDPIAG
ncbi:HvfC/BufC N-terminal domain-containing protein [Planctomicrobium sp. SH664]|uniref:HvfC/BufC N-terminal domain-containing protein n=1 Tax=Planctomicrobium sp. SH664 TaxID=3448125 RepID=UPI003F5C5270